ncbi:MAG TPA: helix-turn-helix transcriptional regulator [Candidatus Binatia bacterium]
MSAVPDDIKYRVSQALKRLRMAKPEFRNYTAFAKASGIHRPTIENTEKGITSPGIDVIEKWVRACGSTLTALFAEVENVERAGIRIIAGEEHYYRLLTNILEMGHPTYVGGIKANLNAHEIASRTVTQEPADSPAATPAPRPRKADRGNIARKVRKKQRVGQRSDW